MERKPSGLPSGEISTWRCFDMMMPGMSGWNCSSATKESHPECEVILLTGQGSIETAVEAMKLGAFDYLQKPFSLKELESVAEKAFERRLLRKENTQLKAIIERDQPSSSDGWTIAGYERSIPAHRARGT
jgi:DNA-binding NtrC family response regulator